METVEYKKAITGFTLKSIASLGFGIAFSLVLQKQGVSNAVIISAFALMQVVAIGLDVPTGVIADKFSLKGTVLLASVLDILAFISFACARGNEALIYAAFALKGIGTALESGALRIFVLDVAKQDLGDHDAAIRKSSRHVQYAGRVASVFGTGGSYLLLNLSPDYVWALYLITTLASAAIIYTTHFDHSRQKKFETVAAGLTGIGSMLRQFATLGLLPVLLYMLLEGFRNGTDTPAFSPFMFTVLGGGLSLLWIPAISTVVRIPFIEYGSRLKVKPDRQLSAALFSFLAIGCLFFLMALYPISGVALPSLALVWGLYSLRDLLFDQWLMHFISSRPKLRATTLSTINVVSNMMMLVGAWVMKHFDLLSTPRTVYFICGSVVVIGCVFALSLNAANGRLDEALLAGAEPQA